MKNNKVLRYTTLAMFLAIAIVVNYLESFIPSIGIPGVKLGLANIVILICLYKYKAYEAFTLDILRVLATSLLRGSFLSITFYMSLAGAVLSFLAMLALKQIKILKPLVISVVGAIFHVVGQIGVAMIIMQTSGILFYLPVIMLTSIITGVFNGIISERIMIIKVLDSFNENRYE